MKRVALLAVGSFNPPTIAHLRMLEVARDHLEDRKTQVIEGIMSPVADSYNSKPSLIKSNHRIEMVRAATESSSWIRADDWECTRGTWTRTIDVLTHHKSQVQKKFGSDVGLILVVGGDLVDSFPRLNPDGSNLWNPDEIVKIISEFGLIVLSREGSNPISTVSMMNKISEVSEKIMIIQDEACPSGVSSTRLRAAISAGKSIKYATPDPVIQYIKCNQLYRSDLIVTPPECIIPATGGTSTHKIFNGGADKLLFKIMSSNNNEYRITPVFGFINPFETIFISVTRTPGIPKKDKLVIHFANAPADAKDAQAAFCLITSSGTITIPLWAIGHASD